MQQQPGDLAHQVPDAATWVLTGNREAIAQSREYMREFLNTLDHPVAPALLGDSLLVVSELVTNAVLHAPGPSTLHIAFQDGVLLISVRDSNPALPIPRVPDPAAATGGFGWHLLTSLTFRIDVQLHADEGKTVTAAMGERPVSQPGDQQ